MSGMEAVTKRVADSFERMSLPILIVSLLLTGFLAYYLVGSLAFTTDLSSFAPETDADDAQERIEGSIGTSPHLVYINVKPAASENQVANALEMRALQQLAEDHKMVQTYSDENGFFISSQINVVEILQRFLEQSNLSGNLSDFKDWKEMLKVLWAMRSVGMQWEAMSDRLPRQPSHPLHCYPETWIIPLFATGWRAGRGIRHLLLAVHSGSLR